MVQFCHTKIIFGYDSTWDLINLGSSQPSENVLLFFSPWWNSPPQTSQTFSVTFFFFLLTLLLQMDL